MPNVTDRVRFHSARILGIAPTAPLDIVRAALASHVGEDNVDRLLTPTNREAALLPETDRLVSAARFLTLTGTAQKVALLGFLIADAKLPTTQQAFPPVPDQVKYGHQDALVA